MFAADRRYMLFLDRVKKANARKLAHMRHGPLLVIDKWRSRCAVKIAVTPYQVFRVVHVSKLKLVKKFPGRPMERLRVNDADRVDFDEALLPEDSWVGDLAEDEFEVEKITDVR